MSGTENSAGSKPGRTGSPWCYFLIAVAVLAVWGYSVTFSFVWDDEDFIQNSPSIYALNNIPSMFYSLEAQALKADHYKVFRPLRTTVYAVLVAMGGGTAKPWLFHLNNVLWHATASMLLMAACSLLFQKLAPGGRGRWLGFLCGLLYAVHPVTSEVVCWAKGLDDIMAAAFTFAALYALLRWPERRGAYAGSVFFFLLAVYSKVSALPFCVFAGLVLLLVHRCALRACVARTLPYAAVAVLFMVHRHIVIGQSQQIDPISGTYGQTLIDMLPVVGKYARLLCGVPPFFIDYSYMRGGHALLSAPIVAGALLLVVLITVTFICLRGPSLRPAGLGLAWTGLFLLPVSNIMPMMQYMAERFLYLPLAGWILLMVATLSLIKSGRLLAIISGLLVLGYAGTAADRSTIWKDNLELFMRSTQDGPRTERVEDNAIRATFQLPNMAMAVNERSDQRILLPPGEHPDKRVDWEAAFQGVKILSSLYPTNGMVTLAYGVLYAKSGDRDEALAHLELALSQAGGQPLVWANLGLLYMDLDRLGEAQNCVERAVALDNEDVSALKAKARLQRLRGDVAASRLGYEEVLRLKPDDAVAKEWLDRLRDE